MNKEKTTSKRQAKKPASSKNESTRRTQAASANDNQNQIDHHSQTSPGEQPRRKPVTNADEQKKTSNADTSIDEEDSGYEGPNDPGKRGDDPGKTSRESPKMK